ncbi:MAG: 4-hydroxythreonine-4-phosphate dehydrogenase PdxA [Pirellulales bacterium]|nr:4-hydroxythreonine-4-phosphate dehydrogenase PdxA [Pirellulales bacterium]
MNRERPTVALTMGDPAGVGPEILVGAWTHPELLREARPVALGHPEILRRAARLWKLEAEVKEIDSVDEAAPSETVLPCLRCGTDDVLEVKPGTIDARAGQAAYDAVVAGARLALNGEVDAVTTAPLHKEALHLAGHRYPGHTELLAELCGVDDFAMMLYLGAESPNALRGGLAVVHVTLHTALHNVFEELNEESVLAKARLADRFMTRLNGQRPRVGVCALNPHGGEGGLFGTEERTIIRPAIDRGRAEGMDLDGPFPADTLMVHARDGRYDAVVAMYHDQGHIALKLLGMHRAVNVTLGLPIIRTSVAHGTAFDLAWQGKAEVRSMIEAVRVASRLAASSRQ